MTRGDGKEVGSAAKTWESIAKTGEAKTPPEPHKSFIVKERDDSAGRMHYLVDDMTTSVV